MKNNIFVQPFVYQFPAWVCTSGRILCELSGTRVMRKYYPREKRELCTCNPCVLLETVSRDKGQPVGDSAPSPRGSLAEIHHQA